MVVFRAEEQNHLQLMEREEMDGEDDLFEAIEKCKIQIISSLSLSALPIVSSIDFYSHPPPCLSVFDDLLFVFLFVWMLKSQLEFYLLIYILFSAPQLGFSICMHFSLFQFEFVHENRSMLVVKDTSSLIYLLC
jgi:hypothetical protein